MASEQEIRTNRLAKLAALRQSGINPYPERFVRSHKLAAVPDLKEKTKLILAGRLVLFREMGKLTFGQIMDDTGRLQVVFSQEELGQDFDFLKEIDLGDFLGLEGERFTTHKGEPSILVKKITLLGKALRPLPEKWHGLADEEIKYRQRYLDLISDPESMARFQFRSKLIQCIREFYWQEDFLEVETPTLLHAATGTAARPYQTHNNGLDIDVFLRVSHELPLKELIIGGFDKIFELGKAFRNEGVDPSHLPEHTHLEHYCAYWNFEDNIAFTQKMLDHIFAYFNLDKKIKLLDKDGIPHDVDFTTPWKRINFCEEIKVACGIDLLKYESADALRQDIKAQDIVFEDMDKMGLATLADNLYKKVVRPQIINPTIVTGYPTYLEPLARLNDNDPRRVDNFQIVVNGWEIVNAYSELVDPLDQAERFFQQAKAAAQGDEEAQVTDDDFVVALEYGAPPISGWGMGVDRLVAILTQQPTLREVVLFPLLRPKKGSVSKPAAKVVKKTPAKKSESSLPLLDLTNARKLVEKYISEQSTRYHLRESEAILRALAKHFGEDEDTWALTGLIHDLDWERMKTTPEQHGLHTMEILEMEGFSIPEEVAQAIRSHNAEYTGVERESRLDYCLAAGENLTGLITSYAKMRPSKNLAGAEASSLTKKFKDKSFAANVRRDIIDEIEKAGMTRSDFFTLGLRALEEISSEIGM